MSGVILDDGRRHADDAGDEPVFVGVHWFHSLLTDAVRRRLLASPNTTERMN